jgi:hypothetical protein
MKMAEILRKVADLIDGEDTAGADFSSNKTQQRLDVVKPSEPELDDNPVMIPPLQAKLEILKKSEGLPNVYGCSDELSSIKKNAGLSAAQQEASEDNDFLG